MKKLFLLTCIAGLLLPVFATAQDVVEQTAEGTAQPAEETKETAEVPVVENVDAGTPTKFLDKLTWKLFASGYYLFNTNLVDGPYTALGYPFDTNHGFGSTFVGGGASYLDDKWGLTIDIYYEPTNNAVPKLSPVHPLKQGFLSWLPCDKLVFDLGFFDTPFGGEVADEWKNANFTRGAQYFLLQPFNHMGLRTKIQATDKLAVTLLVTNGLFNANVLDNNTVPAVGGQLAIGLGKSTVSLGYMTGAGTFGAPGTAAAELGDESHWMHFFDAVAVVPMNDFTLTLNGDLIIDPERNPDGNAASKYGVSAQGIYAISEKFALGARGEYVGSSAGGGLADIITGTLTLRYMPATPLVLSLEPRFEWSDPGTYINNAAGGTKKTFFGILLGATVHLGNS